ncbi:MAG: response regulator [Planctomycetota bacterium]|jgi:DNA-binding response OmpR family regulator
MAGSILVVDDEARIRKAVTVLLQNTGYTVADVDNAKDAFRMATANEYDVILMDLNMPGINGLEGIRSIRLIREAQKIIVLTGYSTDRTREQALEAGASACLFKPGGIRELIPEISRLLGAEEQKDDSEGEEA